MPLVPQKDRGFNVYATPPVEPVAPTLKETFGAAWTLENDVANVVDMMARPQFAPQEGFRVGPSLRDYDTKNRTSLFTDYGDEFMGVQSEDEMLYKVGRINEQLAKRETLSRAGTLGFVAAVASGLASPTSFIPFITGGKGLVAVARGAASTFAATLPAELALQANQETRTAGETAFALAASTALGGILGGAISVLRKGEKEILEQELIGAGAISRGASVGAAAVERESAGGLASGAGGLAALNDRTVVLTNPVTQTINQTEYESFRVLMQQLSDSGLRMSRNEEGVATSVGGTIENRLHHYTGMLVRGDEAFDDAYSRYIFEGDAPRVAPNLRAQIAGQFGSKLSASEFADEVSRAIWNGYEHAVPEVAAAAKATAATVYEPLLKAAQEAKLLPDDVKVVGDEAYVNRVYNNQAIKAYTDEFVSILARNYEKDLNQRFTEELTKFKGKQAKQKELAEDLARPESEVAELEKKFRDELKAIDENLPEEIQMLEEAIATNRATARAMLEDKSIGAEATRKQLLDDARAMEKEAGEPFAAIKGKRAELRRRVRNLSKAVVAVGEKQAKKLERIDRIEELSLNSLGRLVTKAQRTLKNLERWSDDKLDEEVSRLRTQFAQTAKLYDRGEERLVQLADDEDLHKLGVAEDLQTRRAERLDSTAERLEKAEGLPRAEIREALEAGLQETLAKVNKINTQRAQRSARLREQAAALDPKIAKQRLDETLSAIPKAEGEFARRWQGENFQADSVDLDSGIADFKNISRQNAELVKDKILGTYLRLPYSDVLQERRGAELRRVLHISSNEIEKFLDKDVRRLTRIYTRTLGPDIEFMNKFGTLNGEELLKPAIDEMNAKIRALATAPKPEGKTQMEWDTAQAKRSVRIADDFATHKKNVVAVMERLRGTRGMPSDPDGFAYRAARTIMNLNVLRMMGMVTISSFPDAARPVMRYGLTRVFRDGFAPLVTNLKAMKMNVAEAKLAGVGTNVSAHMRSMAYRDVTDELYRGSKAEKAIEWTSNRMGMVALFDYWTQGGEMISSAVANGKIMDSLAKLNADDGSISLADATTFLAENGIDGPLAERIWKQVSKGGGGKVDGIWWPNTESWDDPIAMRAYRAALAREALNTIPRPGAERALLSDTNMMGRMLYQFKSFGMASMPKILMSGLQQRDAAALSGAMASLGLGALSYYTWGMVSGGKAREEMLNADLDKWADEAISRSGLVGNFGEVQRIAQNIPLFSPYTSFSGTKQTRRPGDDIIEAVLGPSFDFAQKTGDVITGLDDPTQSTLGAARRLTPFQNTIILREALDAAEAAMAKQLPERRGQ